jgi:hypothetical protein
MADQLDAGIGRRWLGAVLFAAASPWSRSATRRRKLARGVSARQARRILVKEVLSVAGDVEIPLASAIRALRSEIVEAVRAAGEQDIRFALGPVELELQVQAAAEVGGEAGIKFWLVSIGARGSRSSGTTHTVKLTLTPVRVSAEAGEQRDVLVASELEQRD